MTDKLISHIITLFRQNPLKVDVIEDGADIKYAGMVFHPLNNVKGLKSIKELNDVHLTGYRFFVEEVSGGLKLKLFPIEMVTPRNGMPHWGVDAKEGIEHVAIKDESNQGLFDDFEAFKAEHAEWKRTSQEDKLTKITDEFSDYQNKLTFEDPFTGFMEQVFMMQQEAGGSIDSYQQQEPDIMDFERE